jgi:hypothetical protein
MGRAYCCHHRGHCHHWQQSGSPASVSYNILIRSCKVWRNFRLDFDRVSTNIAAMRPIAHTLFYPAHRHFFRPRHAHLGAVTETTWSVLPDQPYARRRPRAHAVRPEPCRAGRLPIRSAAQLMPSAAVSETMCPASANSASEREITPRATSTSMKPKMMTKAQAIRLSSAPVPWAWP